MKTVWKYILELTDHQTIKLPAGHQILHVGRCPATGQLAMWVLVEPDHTTVEPVKLRVAGTGHPIEGEPAYLGTVILGAFVWHVFQE